MPPEPTFMELWDSVTNEVSSVPHPIELQTTTLFRPTLLRYDDTSILLVNANVTMGTYLQDIYKYTYNQGWTKIAHNPSPLNSVDQSGAYLLSNPNLSNFETLDACSTSNNLFNAFLSLRIIAFFLRPL